MIKGGKLIVAVFLLVCFIETGLSIKCYDCRSDQDPKCGDPFDNTTMPFKDCNNEPNLEHLPNLRPTLCRKIRQKVNGKWTFFRSCAFLGEPGIGGDERYCLMRTGSYNIFMEYCTCNSKDGCNSGTINTGTLLLSLLSATLTLGYLIKNIY